MDVSGKITKVTGVVIAIVVIVAVIGGVLFIGISPKPPEKINLILGWIPGSQFVGHYVALDKGWYEDAGLEVEITPGKGTMFAAQVVGTGKVDFGICSGAALVTGRTQGIPAKSVALLHMHNPVCFDFIDPDIETPQDWVGRKVGVDPTSSTTILYYVLLAKLGIDPESIIEVPIGYEILTPLSTGMVDVAPDYDVWIYKNRKVLPDMEIIRAVDYGVDMYNHCIIANDTYIRDNPDIVKKFVRETLRGWEYAHDHEEEAIDILISYVPELDRDIELGTLKEVWKSTMAWDWDEFGHSDKEGWLNVQNLLYEYGFIKRELEDIDDLFTNEFLPS